MSRAYRVTWVNVSGTVTTTDTLTVGLSMLPILAPSEMVALLREELAAAGWKRHADGSLSTRINDLPVTVDAEATKLTVTADAEGDVKERGVNAEDAARNLERGKVKAQEHLEGQLAKRLTDVETPARDALQEAMRKVYVRALKTKAESMGSVESVLEGDARDGTGDYEVTIKVRVPTSG